MTTAAAPGGPQGGPLATRAAVGTTARTGAAALLLAGAADLVFLNGWVFPRVVADRSGPATLSVRRLVSAPVAVDRPLASAPPAALAEAAPAPSAAAPEAAPAEAAPPEAAPAPASTAPDLSQARLKRLRQVFFAHNAQELDPESLRTLEALIARVKSGPATLVIDGHTDQTGTETYNGWLSEQRAARVAAQLEALGVPRERMIVRHYGSTRPAIAAELGQSVRRNRRVEIALVEGGTP